MFYDLENTLIHHWTDKRPCWTEGNRKYRDECDPDVVGIFSLALWCDSNIHEFINGGVMDMIADAHGFYISEDHIVDVRDMWECEKFEDCPSDRHNEKEYFFYNWCNANKDTVLKGYKEVWLVDDTVEEGEDTESFDFKIVFRNPVVIKTFI